MSVGERIRAARERKKLTQADVAEKLGVAQSAVAHWESGENQPRAKRLRDLAEFLGVRLSDLIPVDDEGVKDGGAAA